MSADGLEHQPGDRRNLGVLFLVSVLIGLGVAVYEVALPLFLKERAHLGWQAMGWIYGAGAAVTFVIRWGVGAWSDRAGRKIVYVGALLATGLATLVTPCSANVFVQGALKSVADPTARLREAMHSVLLYECWPKRFQSIFSKTRGVEFLFHFFGLLLAAVVLTVMARRGVESPHAWFIGGAALLLLLSGVIFAFGFRERPMEKTSKPALRWRDFLHMRLSRPLWVLTISSMVFNMGIMISHCFALQLFFQEKYHATDTDIFTIGALHRLSSSVTLLLLGHVFRTRLRMWMVIFLVCEGVFIAAPGFLPDQPSYTIAGFVLPTLWTVVVIWLGHDFLGMSMWLPIQQTLMQRHTRPGSRGEDITLATALGALGAVPAPFIAGWLRQCPGLPGDAAVNLPFIVSGLGVALSAVVLLWLPRESEAPAPRLQPETPADPPAVQTERPRA